ncbi:tetratricopeptide repeat protein [Polyangium jinanense]|uniref:tetratricopeptide repeat protein n=1 Tax=Polyangium jinanense TaxID=2829994 RepID=UPI00233FB6D5|nr:tetratricopeptide repeat protein [Polyangium jinanense]MDC3956892.1 tetratricopeptide repeat protein [Polyangium jinanense]
MSDKDDEEPLNPQGTGNAGGNVIPIAGKYPRVAAKRGGTKLASVAKMSLETEEGDETKSNHSLLDKLNAWDLDAHIADISVRIEEGRDDLRPLLEDARDWRAVRSHLRGDREAALAEWAELIEQGSCKALMTRAQYRADDGDLAGAHADYNSAAERAPKDGSIYLKRGTFAYFKLNDNERALADLERAAQLLPKDAEPYQTMAFVLGSLGDEDGSIRALGRAIHRDPWRADLFYERGRRWWSKGSIAEALADLDRSIQLGVTNASAFQLRAFCHEKRGDLPGAIADFTRAIALNPSETAFFMGRGNAHLAMGAYAEAIHDFRQRLELYGWRDDRALRSLGAAHLALGDEERAAAYYRQAFYHDPKLLEDLRLQIRINETLDKPEALRADLDVLFLVEPDGWLRIESAHLWARLGDLEKAIADLDRAVEESPQWDEALFERGRMHARAGRFDRALVDVSRAIELAPHQAKHPAWRALYRAHLEGDTPLARADLQRAVELAHYDDEIRSCSVMYFSLVAKPEEAIADYDILILLSPLDARYYKERGMVREAIGDVEGALADYTRAAELLTAEEDDGRKIRRGTWSKPFAPW